MAWSDAARAAAVEVRRQRRLGAGIGDLVKLNRPISGMRFGQVSGWEMVKGKHGMGHKGAHPFLGAKVAATHIKLKKSPYHMNDYGASVKVGGKGFRVLDSRARMDAIQRFKVKGR